MRIKILDKNIRQDLKPHECWHLPTKSSFSNLYFDNINKILEAFYYKNITNTMMPNYFGFGSCTCFRRILISFFKDEIYAKSKKLKYKHQMDTMLSNRTFNLLSENRPRDDKGKSIWDINGVYTRIKNGNFVLNNELSNKNRLDKLYKKYGTCFAANYWYRTEYNQDLNSEYYTSDGLIYFHNLETYKRGVISYGINCSYNKYGIMRYGYHSKAEDNVCEILSKLSLDYEREIVIPNDYGSTYRVDFYIKDLDIYLEVDGLYKYNLVNNKLILNKYNLIRERYIENYLNKSLIRVLSYKTEYYLTHKREFLNFIRINKYPIINFTNHRRGT